MSFLTLRRFSLATAALFLCTVLLYIAWPVSDAVLGQERVYSTRIEDRHGRLLREIRPDGRGIPVLLDEVSPDVITALIAIEDRNYYKHFGVDPAAILRAMRDNLSAGEVVSGASTLTMQFARILRGRPNRTLRNKIIEALLAIRLEVHLSKDVILSNWLNRAYFGNQTYGIEAASRIYFGKKSLDLTMPEAAYLIGLAQNPVGYDPYRFPEAAEQRFQRVLDALVSTGMLDQNERRRLSTLPLAIEDADQTFTAPHFVTHVSQRHPDLISTSSVVKTTLDARLQREIENLAHSHLQRLNSEFVTNAAAIVIDNLTGEILAYMGSADFWNEQYLGQNDGVQMLRQPGSALKPFTYAHALTSKRYTPASILPDIELQIPEAGGAFAPQNYDKTYHGPVPLRQALASSYNIPAIYLAREITAPVLLDNLHHVGFKSLNRSPEHYGVGLTLGNGEVRLIDLAYAYAAFARGGRSLTPRWLKAAVSPANDSTFFARVPDDRKVISPQVAFLVTDILRDPIAREPAFGRHGPLELPFPTAVKTGTSKDYRDNWAVGFTPRHTVAVWVGNFDGTPMQRVSGVSGAGPLFKSIMLYLGDGAGFERPKGVERREICPASGHLPTAICPLRKHEWFLKGTTPTDSCSVHIEVEVENHRLAHADGIPKKSEKRVFTRYPEQYHAWMRDNNLPFPPETEAISSDAASSTETKPVLAITYPVSGMFFQLDPVLRKAYQKIGLRGIHGPGLKDIKWLVDGQLFSNDFEETAWSLQAGTFSFSLQAVTPSGETVESTPVTITVIDDQPAATRVVSSQESYE